MQIIAITSKSIQKHAGVISLIPCNFTFSKNTRQCLKGAYKKDVERLFTRADIVRKRGNYFKLKESWFRLDIIKTFLV